ncbi:MAG TPA: CADD family putative folate metabolism protein [Patescibacteria group bacterium]|nr:CADD family putative folate metabolism protein [Patescibacteria group bacterium]
MSVPASTAIPNELDRLIEEYHLLKHPFYRAWTEGSLSREQLALYAEQYYQHVRAFPLHLSRLATRATGNLRALVTDNLVEELDPENPHPLLWRRFALAVGAREEALDSGKPLPGVTVLLDTFRELTERASMAEAVSAFYAYEAQVPEISAQKIAGLRRFYDIRDSRALKYFTVHQEADVRHRAAWRGWLAHQNGSKAAAASGAARRALQALWGALDAVYPEGCARN